MSTSRIHARGPVGIQVSVAMMMMCSSDGDESVLPQLRSSHKLCTGPDVDEVGAHVVGCVRWHIRCLFISGVVFRGQDDIVTPKLQGMQLMISVGRSLVAATVTRGSSCKRWRKSGYCDPSLTRTHVIPVKLIALLHALYIHVGFASI